MSYGATVSRIVRAIAAAMLLAFGETGAQQVARSPAVEGRIIVRRSVQTAPREVHAGLSTLDLDSTGSALVYVPAGYRTDRPLPLVVMLHGAGGHPQRVLNYVTTLADSAGILLLAPKSAGATWDVIRGRYGADAASIERLLTHVIAQYAVDTMRIAIGGFSDGATYALSLGITNGDMFTHVIAFSPGFMVPAAQRGEPRLFVSHGTRDQILSIDACSREIVRRLRASGYDVRYREFDGGHTVPVAIAREAFAWLTK